MRDLSLTGKLIIGGVSLFILWAIGKIIINGLAELAIILN